MSKPRKIILTEAEAEAIRESLSSAASDLWQHSRLAEYNLTGRDLNNPAGSGWAIPEKPQTVTRQGLDETLRVHAGVREALQVLAFRLKRGIEELGTCGACVYWDGPDTQAGCADGFCVVFSKPTGVLHGANCTAYRFDFARFNPS